MTKHLNLTGERQASSLLMRWINRRIPLRGKNKNNLWNCNTLSRNCTKNNNNYKHISNNVCWVLGRLDVIPSRRSSKYPNVGKNRPKMTPNSPLLPKPLTSFLGDQLQSFCRPWWNTYVVRVCTRQLWLSTSANCHNERASEVSNDFYWGYKIKCRLRASKRVFRCTCAAPPKSFL